MNKRKDLAPNASFNESVFYSPKDQMLSIKRSREKK